MVFCRVLFLQASVGEVGEMLRQGHFRRERLANSDHLMKGASKLDAKGRESFTANANKLREEVRKGLQVRLGVPGR